MSFSYFITKLQVPGLNSKMAPVFFHKVYINNINIHTIYYTNNINTYKIYYINKT